MEYVKAKAYKKSIRKETERLNQVQPWIGHVPLHKLHMGLLQPFIAQRRKDAVKSRTINQALKIVRQVVNFAAEELIDEYGSTWLESAPKTSFYLSPICVRRVRCLGTTRRAFFRNCRIIWPRWPCSSSIRDFVMRKSADCAGNGR